MVIACFLAKERRMLPTEPSPERPPAIPAVIHENQQASRSEAPRENLTRDRSKRLPRSPDGSPVRLTLRHVEVDIVGDGG